MDEPEVYLHPDVQRRLLGVLKGTGPDILLATHSTEIIAEADPSDIVLIDKRKQSAERIRDIDGVQKAMNLLGSQQNISLAALARNRRVLFVEGDYDFNLIRRFARRRGMGELGVGSGLAAMPSGGFGSWNRIASLAEGISQALGTHLLIGAVYDRDYFCNDQIIRIQDKLSKSLSFSRILSCKEIENYLLIPAVLERLVDKEITEKLSRGASVNTSKYSIAEKLAQISEELKEDTEDQYTSRYTEYHKERSSKDTSTLLKEARDAFREEWRIPATRLRLISGKEALRRLRNAIQNDFGVTITDAKIVDAMRIDEFSPDLLDLLDGLESFRVMSVA